MSNIKLVLCGLVALMFISGHSYASTRLEQRQKAVDKLEKQYPCTELDEGYFKDFCEKYFIILRRDESLELPDKDWNEKLRQMKSSLEEWKVETARVRNGLQPKLGMSKDKIYKHVLGPPKTINDTLDARGQTSQWVYEIEGGTLYLYFNAKGILVSMQRSNGG